MSANSKIEWTTHTFNPWIGCTKVSPGCLNCYAETQNELRKWNPAGWGKGVPRKRTSENYWKQPLKWNRDVEAAQRELDERRKISDPHNEQPEIWQAARPRVFCASLADWLDDEVPVEWLADLLVLIHATPNLDWMLLTKRPENFQKRIYNATLCLDSSAPLDVVGVPVPSDGPNAAVALMCEKWRLDAASPANVWIGTTVEDQQRADERIPKLLKIPARVRFLSCEPLLGAVDLRFKGSTDVNFPDDFDSWTEKKKDQWFSDIARATYIARCENGIDLVICGGESGPDARPMHPDWARSLRDQCVDAGVPFFFKQWGEWVRDADIHTGAEESKIVHFHGDAGDFRRVYRVGKKKAGRMLDGREWNELPS